MKTHRKQSKPVADPEPGRCVALTVKGDRCKLPKSGGLLTCVIHRLGGTRTGPAAAEARVARAVARALDAEAKAAAQP